VATLRKHSVIQEYVHRAERLSRRIPQTEDYSLAVAFIRGMKDESERKLVSSSLRTSKSFTFEAAMEAVKAVYQ
jgi:hypothetical protein